MNLLYIMHHSLALISLVLRMILL